MNHPAGSEQRPGCRYRRSPGVVWRQGPDRILVHRVGVDQADAAADLVGGVALVWLALDEPAGRDEIRHRLAEAEVTVDDVTAEIERLIDAGLIETAERTS